MAKILPAAPFEGANENLAATTAPQDVSREDAATFDVLRKMREDILCCVLKPDQKLKFGAMGLSTEVQTYVAAVLRRAAGGG